MNVVIVGGGASGLVAAIVAARNGASVTVLERNSSCGKKILVTGNGKCNYYNVDQAVNHYHSSSEFIFKIINDKNMQLVLDFFTSIGVVPKIKKGYYYPYSNQSISVLNALLLEASVLSIKIITNTFVKDVINNDGKFVVVSDNGEYIADKVIVASGSYAYYKKMEINSYDLLKRLGHTIVKPLPALVQLKSDDSITKKWAGVRADVILKLYQDGKFIREENGELLLTNYGISGICAMQLSRDVARGLDCGIKQDIYINFVPTISSDVDSFISYLHSYSNLLKKRSVSSILDNLLNYKLGNAILSKLKINPNVMFDDLSYNDIKNLASNVVKFNLKVSGTNSFGEAQVCSGGVSILDINLDTMESLKVKNLYVVGEVLDVDGDCGGYNLTFAWLSGILAGQSIMRGDNCD